MKTRVLQPILLSITFSIGNVRQRQAGRTFHRVDKRTNGKYILSQSKRLLSKALKRIPPKAYFDHHLLMPSVFLGQNESYQPAPRIPLMPENNFSLQR
ncbi:Uncharacterised protein [Yersinia nurmii]|uniref:Secreted protein n=1 Tax=Yersinia nurmii TaxID=685706 RepID=A0ABM9S145_9GAMM|nr:Uncharacterised protein [Yersinia nurmii]